MNEFFTCVISKNGMAYLTGVVIFLITLFLTSRKIIGFTLTLLLLIFALIAALAVANQDIIRGYFVHPAEQQAESTYKGSAETSQNKTSDINADLQKAFDDLKKEFLIEKERLQKIWEDYNARKEQEDKTPATPVQK